MKIAKYITAGIASVMLLAVLVIPSSKAGAYNTGYYETYYDYVKVPYYMPVREWVCYYNYQCAWTVKYVKKYKYKKVAKKRFVRTYYDGSGYYSYDAGYSDGYGDGWNRRPYGANFDRPYYNRSFAYDVIKYPYYGGSYYGYGNSYQTSFYYPGYW